MPARAEGADAPRVLFVAESVALAHVSRPLVLAEALSSAGYDVHFACSARYANLVAPPIRFHALDSIDPARFLDQANRGAPVYRSSDAREYADAEQLLLDQLRPALVVSDFRYSAPSSAQAAGVACAVLVNAHWSPFRHLPFPAEPPAAGAPPRRVGWRRRLARGGGDLAHHHGDGHPDDVDVFNEVRRRRHQEPLESYEALMTAGDHVLYVDPPSLIEVVDLPEHHRFLGPVVWAPPIDVPEWWDDLPTDRPLAYVTAGSTGDVDRVHDLAVGLQASGVGVMVATAGRLDFAGAHEGIWTAPMLPGSEACRRSSVVVCNGGSATAYQALAAGRPTVGLWTNNDQYLTATALSERGVGVAVAPGTSGEDAAHAALRVASDAGFGARARVLAEEIERWHAPTRFVEFVAETTGTPSPPHSPTGSASS